MNAQCTNTSNTSSDQGHANPMNANRPTAMVLIVVLAIYGSGKPLSAQVSTMDCTLERPCEIGDIRDLKVVFEDSSTWKSKFPLVGGDWHDSKNWTGGVPGQEMTAVIPGGSVVNITDDVNVQRIRTERPVVAGIGPLPSHLETLRISQKSGHVTRQLQSNCVYCHVYLRIIAVGSQVYSER